MKKIMRIIQILFFLISLALLSSCFENLVQDEQNGQNTTVSIPHNTALAGRKHHYTSDCSSCHGTKSVSCDSCHSSGDGCNDCHR